MTTSAQASANEGSSSDGGDYSERQWWMGILARATREDLETVSAHLPARDAYQIIKRPEIGTIMVEARAGGAGRRFNFGEATMTRCVVQLKSGELGFSYALGRDKAKVEQAALIDALLQTDKADRKASILSQLKQIDAKHNAEKILRSRKAAATKVNFFTLVRGEG